MTAREGDGVAGLPPLPEPLHVVAVAGYHDGVLRDALEAYYDEEQLHAYAVAYHAMQAQQAVDEAVLDRAKKYDCFVFWSRDELRRLFHYWLTGEWTPPANVSKSSEDMDLRLRKSLPYVGRR